MKIGIDARLYGTKNAGLGRYLEKLISRLEQLDQKNDYLIFLTKENFNDYRPNQPNFRKILADFKPYSWQEQLIFPAVLWKYRLDLVHFGHFNVPLVYWGKFLVTIHDLIISRFPSSRATTRRLFSYRLKLFGYRLVISRAARRAKKIIAVSEATKKDIVRLLKIPSEKVVVVYEGVELGRAAGNCRLTEEEYGLKPGYLFYLGSAYPHKNLENLVAAFKKVVDKFPDQRLVLAGKDSYFYQRLKRFLIENFPELQGKVFFPGYLSDFQINCFFRRAKIYVFPSLFEGFGLPALEAQARGVPVAASDRGSLPEILGSTAHYFNPEDSEAIAAELIKLLSQPELCRELAGKGLANSQKYSWEKTARKTLTVYQSFF